MIKAIIIGCGKIAGLYDDIDDDYIYSHAKAYSLNENIDLIGCCDLDIDNAKKLSEKYSIKMFSSDYIEMMKNNKIDIISVCTPNNTHFNITKSILESDFLPKIIFLEKPACQNIEQLDELIALSDKKNVKIVVNHSRRFDILHNELKEKIEQNEFGKLIKIDAIYYSGWQHNGVHIIDTLSFLFDDELEFNTLLHKTDSPYQNDFNLDFKCNLKKSGALVYITTMDERYYQLFEFDLKFKEARVRVEDFGNRVSYEKKIINNMNENILVKEKFDIVVSSKSSMQIAVEKMVENLINQKSLDGYLIKDISRTMKTVWEGLEWIR